MKMKRRVFYSKAFHLFALAVLLLLFNACSTNKSIPLYPESLALLESPLKKEIARLNVPIEIDLIYHNGQSLSFIHPYQKQITYELLAGEHHLGFQYQDIHFDDDENQEIITSKIAFIHFVAKDKENYDIGFNAPIDYLSAKQLENNFDLTLSVNDKMISSSSNTNNPLTENSRSEPVTEQTDVSHSPLINLQRWWKKSTPADQKAFILWIEAGDES